MRRSMLTHSYLVPLILCLSLHLQIVFGQDSEMSYEGAIYSYFQSDIGNFDEAEDHCQTYTGSRGGLAELTTPGIRQAVEGFVGGQSNVWVGAKKISGTFKWVVAGTDVDGVIGAGSGKDCVYLKQSGQLKADRCTSASHGAICSQPASDTTTSETTLTTTPTLTTTYMTVSTKLHESTTPFLQTITHLSATHENSPSTHQDTTFAETTRGETSEPHLTTLIASRMEAETVATSESQSTATLQASSERTTYVEATSLTSNLTTFDPATTTIPARSTTIATTTEFPLNTETPTAASTFQTTPVSTTLIPVFADSTSTGLSTSSVEATTTESSATLPAYSASTTEDFTNAVVEITTTAVTSESQTIMLQTLSTATRVNPESPTTLQLNSTDTMTSQTSNDITTNSGNPRLFQLLLSLNRKKRMAPHSLPGLGFSTKVPIVGQLSSNPGMRSIATTTHTMRNLLRGKRDSYSNDGDDECSSIESAHHSSSSEEQVESSFYLPNHHGHSAIGNLGFRPTTFEMVSTAEQRTANAHHEELTTCAEPCDTKQSPSTSQTSTSKGSTAAIPTATEHSKVNVSEVVGRTQNTSSFSSAEFVTELEKWFAANNKLPDDLNDEERLQYAKSFFEVCNNVFNANLLELGETDAASIFADSCSNLAQDFTADLNAGQTLNISTANVDVYSSVHQGNNFTGFKQIIEDDDFIDNDADSETVQLVIVPPDIVDNLHLSGEDTISISVVVYKRGDFIVDYKDNTTHRPAGPVVSITVVVNDNITSVPVEFQLENDISRLPNGTTMVRPENATCVFWDTSGDGELGAWSDFGCEVLNATREFTHCACNHTTHFGVLLQVREFEIPPVHDFALTLLTYIGAGVSIACLVITLLILNLLTSLTSDRVKIHKNLVAALIIAQVIFLSVDAASQNTNGCKVVTLLVHYFYLCVFCWSLLEGLNLYIQIVQVFSTGKTLKYFHYLLIGWGVPIPIAAISAGTRWTIYGANNRCWLSPDGGLIWALVGPVIFAIVSNLIILCMVVRVIVKSASVHKKDNYDHIKAGVKGALLLVPILGLGWVFGFLSLGQSTLVFTYLFVITVGLQGVLIFLLYCAFNSEVRAALKRKHEKRKLRRGEGLSSIPTPSSINSGQSNETSSTTFASKLIDRIKRRMSSTTAERISPVDTIHLVDRSESAQSTRDIMLHQKKHGSIDSGYSQNAMHRPTSLPSDSMASIRTEPLPPDEFVPPHTPTYE